MTSIEKNFCIPSESYSYCKNCPFDLNVGTRDAKINLCVIKELGFDCPSSINGAKVKISLELT
jgi:hypothetical protein